MTERLEYKVTQVGVFAGAVFPEKFLEAMFLNRSSTVGFAVVDDSEGKPEISLVQAPSSELGDWIGAVKEARAGFKDKDMLFAFGEYPKEFKAADIQPYPLVLDGNGKPVVVAAIEGVTAEATNGAVEGQSDALGVIEGYLGPKFAEQYKAAGNDPNKFEGLINGARFRGELAWLNVTMTIMTQNGKLISISPPEGKKGTDFEWGYTTDAFGFSEGEVKEKEPVLEVKKPSGLLDRMSKAASAVNNAGKAAPTTTGPKLVAGTDPITTKKHPEGGSPIDWNTFKRGDKLPEGYEWASPPLGKDNKGKREWYVSNDVTGKGIVPSDYKNSPIVPVRSANTKLKAELEKTTANNTPAAKDVTNHNLKTVPPFMTFEAKQRFEKFMKKGRSSAIVDKDTKAIMDPGYIKTLENDVPSFAAETGVPWRACYNWDDAALKEMVGDRTEAFLLLRDLRNFALKTEQAQFQGKPPVTADVKPPQTTTKPGGLLARMAVGK